VPPLLRGLGGALVVADRETEWPEADLDVEPGTGTGVDLAVAIDEVVAQLAPIRSHATLASSLSREANPDDPIVRAAYARVWADLSLLIARRTTRRARIRATTASAVSRRR
jgi:hypothetical protein